MERVVLTESMILMELMAWKQCKNVNGNHRSDEADRINWTDGILWFRGNVTIDSSAGKNGWNRMGQR